MDIVRAEIWVSGRVQGVFFRAFVKAQAVLLKVSGFVENLKDGRVHAVFEGEKANVEKLVKLCRKGPPTSKVTNLEVKYSDKTEGLSGFLKVKGLGLFGK